MKKPFSLGLYSFSVILWGMLLSIPLQTHAAGNDIQIPTSGYGQSLFEDLTKELGLASSYIPMAPAEPLGLLGFDVGIEATLVKIDSNASYWALAVSDNDAPGYLPIPKIHIQKGLPLGLDIGAIYAKAPGTNISLWGGELKWAFLQGSTVTPAAAVRGSYTQLTGVDTIDLQTIGLDASISKGFGPLTPYGGVGIVSIKSGTSVPTLSDVDTTATRLFLGAKLSLLLFNVVAEADFSDVPLYSLRVNVGF